MSETAKKTGKNNDPDYEVFFVPNRRNAYWTKFGAAWKNRDGKGYSIDHDFMPVGDGRIVLREYEPQNDDEKPSSKKK